MADADQTLLIQAWSGVTRLNFLSHGAGGYFVGQFDRALVLALVLLLGGALVAAGSLIFSSYLR